MVGPPKSSAATIALILASTCIASTTVGYDGSMMNGLNILPSYTDYFQLNAATLGLNTAALWIGGVLAAFPYGPIMDKYGRKPGLYFAAVNVVIAVILQASAQNTAMFAIARIWVGFASSGFSVIAPAYVAETLPPKWRAWGLGILFDLFYFGGLIAAGITYGTAKMQSTWAWRIPSLLQAVFAFMSLFLLPFIPESPRFLQMKGRTDEALAALAAITSDGDIHDVRVQDQFNEIAITLAWEKQQKVLSAKTIAATPSLRKRLFLMLSVAVIVALSGNNIVSYYFGTMLSQAGITDPNTQLLINVILNIFCLACSLGGTWFADKVGRKTLALMSCVAETVFLLLVGILTKVYGPSTNTSGIYATVAMIFLFQGSYSFAWTPLNTIYPPEVLNYSMRAFGLSAFQFVGFGLGLCVTFVFPIALEHIGWKLYVINAGWDVLQVAFVAWYWVETKGLTLESIDAVFVGDAKPHDAGELGGELPQRTQEIMELDEKQ